MFPAVEQLLEISVAVASLPKEHGNGTNDTTLFHQTLRLLQPLLCKTNFPTNTFYYHYQKIHSSTNIIHLVALLLTCRGEFKFFNYNFHWGYKFFVYEGESTHGGYRLWA